MAFLDLILFISLFILMSFSYVSVCDDEYEGIYTLVLEHSFDSGKVFSKRGMLRIHSLKSGHGEYVSEDLLSSDEIHELKSLAKTDGMYRVRVGRASNNENTVNYIYSFVKACSLYESRLSDRITVHIDSSGSLIGVSVTTPLPYCSGNYPDVRSFPTDFNTTVAVQQTANGPAPETDAYIKKLEQEKQQAKGEQADNRSFFAKYWIYIVPFFIFMMLAQNLDPNGGAGSGAAR